MMYIEAKKRFDKSNQMVNVGTKANRDGKMKSDTNIHRERGGGT